MNRLFIVFFLCGLFSTTIRGQMDEMPVSHEACQLPPAPFEGYLYVPPSPQAIPPEDRSMSSISVNFLTNGSVFGYGCISWPADAQAAMEFAAGLWEGYLDINQPITVNACWSTQLGGSTLGAAGSTAYYLLTDGTNDTWYQVALAEHLLDQNINNANVELQAVFNANRSDWYFGTDGVVAFNKIDFTTVALHELGHGLGFAGGRNIDNGIGQAECDGIAGEGCYGFDATGAWTPDIYSRQMERNDGLALEEVNNPSVELANLLTGQNGGILAGSAAVIAANGNPAPVYTPTSYSSGSSYAHWDLSTFSDELMKPQLSYGQAIHDPGLGLNLFEDMGWSAGAPLPVEWVSFTVRNVEAYVLLEWETATEVNNAGFEVQRSRDGKLWESLDFVEGKGIASAYQFRDILPYSGINYYRLIQTDYDGATDYSTIQSIYFDTDEVQVRLSPNPARSNLTVACSGFDNPIPASLYNARGKKLLSELIDRTRQEIDISHLPVGAYWLKVGTSEVLSFYKQ